MTARLAQELSAQLTDKDQDILHRVLELRFVSGNQLGRMYCADTSARAARRALLRLVQLDVLERLPRSVGGVRAGSAGFVYRVGLAGERVALEQGWMEERRRRRARLPGMLFLNHSLAVAELHTQLIEANHGGRLELLELQAEPGCHRRYGPRAILKPDSFVRLGSGDYELSYFIEVDLGSEGSWALDSQLRAYAAYYVSGVEQAERGVFPKVLWLVPDNRRVAVLETCIGGLPRPARELFEVGLFKDVVSVVSNTSGVTDS